MNISNPVNFIKEKDIQIKDSVFIQRSGEVIPYIVWVIRERIEGIKILQKAKILINHIWIKLEIKI